MDKLSNHNKNDDIAIIPSSAVLRGKILGDGGFGRVYAGSWNTRQVAIKVIRDSEPTEKQRQLFFQEAQLLARLQHPRIVQFYGISKSPFQIVIELLPRGDLYTYLTENQRTIPWSPMRWQFALDIAKGLSYLHKSCILHKDIKSENILLDENLRAKITDFGISKLKATRFYTYTGNGTFHCMAPELMDPKAKKGPPADIYAFAVVLWEIAARKRVFAGAYNPQLIPIWTIQGTREDIPKKWPQPFSEIIKSCWHQNPEQRPTADQAVELIRKVMPKDVVDNDGKTSPNKVIEIPRSLATFVGREGHLGVAFSAVKRGGFTVFSGPHGSGKTEFAIQFANQYIEKFDLIYWIPSKTQGDRKKAFQNLAAKLGIKLNPEDSYVIIQKKVYDTLNRCSFDQPYLLIFDDLVEKETFPKNGSILVTTHDLRHYHNKRIMNISMLDIEEGVELVQKLTGKKEDNKGERDLVNTFGGIAFAIDRACFQIVQRNTSLSSYLKDIDILALLKEKGDKRYTCSLYNRWNDSLKTLDPLALRCLTQLAHLGTPKIPMLWMVIWVKLEQPVSSGQDEVIKTFNQTSSLTTILTSLVDLNIVHFFREEEYIYLFPPIQHMLCKRDKKESYLKNLDLLSSVGAQLFVEEDSQKWGEVFFKHSDTLDASPLSKKIDQKSLANFLEIRGHLAMKMEKYEQSFACFKKVLDAQKKIDGGDHARHIMVLSNIGSSLAKLNRNNEALDYFNQALATSKKVHGDQSLQVGAVLNNFGAVLLEIGKYREAGEKFLRALCIYQKAYGEKNTLVASCFRNCGEAALKMKDYKVALGGFERALEIYGHGNNAKEMLLTIDRFVEVLEQLKMYNDQLKYLQGALIMRSQIGDYPKTADCYHRMGKALRKLGKHKESLTNLKKALSIYKTLGGDAHLDVARVLLSIGLGLDDLGQYDKSVAHTREALGIFKQRLGPEHFMVPVCLNNLGCALSQQDHHEKALVELNKALKIYKKVYGGVHRSVANCLDSIGSAQSRKGDHGQAVATLKQSIELYNNVYKGGHPDAADPLKHLGVALKKLGKRDEALKAFKDALALLKKADHPDQILLSEVQSEIEGMIQQPDKKSK